MKKFFSLVLALVMALSLTTVAWGAMTATELQDEIDAVADGGSYTLTESVDLGSTVLKINKGITLDLGDNTITGEVEIHTTASVTIKNGSITNAAAQGRCIDTRVGANLTINDVVLTTTSSANNQPLTIGADGDFSVKVTVKDSTINAGTAGYAIINFHKTELTIDHSSLNGYAAIYMKDGSNGSVVTIKNDSVLSSVGHSGPSNAFGTISFEDDGITLKADADTTINTEGDQQSIVLPNDSSDNTVVMPAEYADDLAAAGFDAAIEGNGVIEVYPTLQDAVDAAEDGDTILLLDDNNEDVTTDKVITIDSNNNTFSGTLSGDDGVSVNPDGTVATTPSFGTAAGTTKFSEEGTYYVLNANNVWEKVEYVPAEDDGDGTGNVAYFEGTSGTTYIICKKNDDDALKLTSGYLSGDKLLNYVKAVATPNYYGVGTKAAASAVADCDTDAHKKGFKTVDPVTGVPTYWVEVETGNETAILVDDEVVLVKKDTTAIIGGHILKLNKTNALDALETTYEYKCVACGEVFKGVETKAPGVKYTKYDGTSDNADKLALIYRDAGYDITNWVDEDLYLIKTSTPSATTPSTDKVTSAETFDAGIAMYVGMSVMAAAGSAVVIGKKKD